ncbi:MAG: RsiV family protein [Thermodesulfovibrionales bacterium]
MSQIELAASGTWSSADDRRHLPFKLKRVAVYHSYEQYEDLSDMSCEDLDPHRPKDSPCNFCSVRSVSYPLLDSPHGKALVNLLFQRIGKTDLAIEMETTSGKPSIKNGASSNTCKDIYEFEQDEIIISLYAPPLISLKIENYSNVYLAAHPNSSHYGFNVLLVGRDKVRKVELKDLIRATPDCLHRINDIIKEDLRKQEVSAVIDPDSLDKEKLKSLYTRSFILRPDRLIFMFPTYDIASYADGNIQAEVPFRSIADCIPRAL